MESRQSKLDFSAPVSAAEKTAPAKRIGPVELQVGGMHCASCALSIEKELSQLPGIQSAEVSFALQKAVLYAKDKDLTEQAVAKIRALGYHAAPFAVDDIEKPPENHRAVLAALIALPFCAQMAAMLFGVAPFLPLGAVLALAGAAQFYLGMRFYKNAAAALRAGQFSMDTLIAIGTFSAFALSLYWLPWAPLMQDGDILWYPYLQHNYFEAGALVICFVHIGQWLEQRSLSRTRQNLLGLGAAMAEFASIEKDGAVQTIPVSQLQAGQIAVVAAGERFPADGVIIDGASDVDESLLTGEPLPVLKKIGDTVLAGSVNCTKALRIRIEKTGQATRLGFLRRLAQQAAGSKPEIAKKIDRICGVFVPAVLGFAGAVFVLWAGYDLAQGNDMSRAIVNAVTVLVIACPCALGLATPMAVVAAVGLGAKNGILLKKASVLEELQNIDHIVLDKTGTLTEGKPRVTDLVPLRNDTHSMLRLAASAAAFSKHPVSEAIGREAASQKLSLLRPTKVEEIPGQGLIAEFAATGKSNAANPLTAAETVRQTVLVGNRRLLNAHNFDLSPAETRAGELAMDGKTLIFVGASQQAPLSAQGEKPILGLIALQDRLRPGSAEMIGQLKARGLKILLLTGDTKQAAQRAAQKLGIDDVQGDILPEEKAGRVHSLTQRGRKVLMLGDGINDAAALSTADIGIAMAGGSDLAMESADAAFMRADPMQLLTLYALSDLFRRKIRQNLAWAFGFNLIGLPLAAFGVLPPAFAGAAMALSSLVVVSNALSARLTLPIRASI